MTFESTAPLWKRILGEAHPETPKVHNALKKVREKLALALGSASP